MQIHGQERDILKLQLYWGEFCRGLVIKSAIGGYETLTGNVLIRTRVSSISAINMVAKQLCGYSHFPWHVPSYCTNLAQKIGTSNYAQIKAGLSLTAPINDLLIIRNYITHPSKQNQIAYKRVAINHGQPQVAPTKLLSGRVSSGRTLFVSWVDSLRLMAEIAVR